MKLMRISHEASVIRSWWPGDYRVIQSGGNLDRLNSGLAPLLDTHRSGTVRGQLGRIQQAWTEGMETFATVEFDQTDEAQELEQRVSRGEIQNVSMAFYAPRTMRRAEPDIYGARHYIDNWDPFEVSLVADPADRAAIIFPNDYDPQNSRFRQPDAGDVPARQPTAGTGRSARNLEHHARGGRSAGRHRRAIRQPIRSHVFRT